jgi:protease I
MVRRRAGGCTILAAVARRANTDGRLNGKRVAILVDDGYDAREVAEPLASLRGDGAEVLIVGVAAGRTHHDMTGAETLTTDVAAVVAPPFDAIVIPGGYAPDRLRMRHAIVDLIRAAMAAGTVVAAVCRGPQVLISANVVRGRTLTCWPSIAVDVMNAGGLYVDRPVVRDGNLVTARKADDLGPFTDAIAGALVAAAGPGD